jgi:secondary thiamine-phosphate synthase enzyme
MHRFEVPTQHRTQFVDVTEKVQAIVASSGLRRGAALVFVPHTTAGCTINEHADPDVARDILTEIDKTIPFESDYRHNEGNSAAHIKASLFGSSVYVPVEDGRLALGTWQGVFFCEFDGPRRRSMQVQLLEAAK